MSGRCLILGNGASGRAATALAERLGFETRTLDGADAFPGDTAFDGAIVSPGIPLDHPWQVACRAAGIPVRSELQFGCEELKRRGWQLLAVTGSKGKSSVVRVVADALSLEGRRAVACGNYGLPVCDVALSAPRPSACDLRRSDRPWAVVEVSSFMMETTDLAPDAFEAAAVINLQEDHLDRHGSVAAYHALKRRLLGFAKTAVGGGAVIVPTREEGCLLAGSYFDNEILRSNGACAIRLMRAAGLGDPTVAAAFRAFVPLAHRMNEVGVFGGVRCVDDSKATSLAALEAGVRMCRGPVRLIAGGLPKGDDPKDVLPALTERVRKVYLIGRSAGQFSAAWSDAVDCEVCGTLERAVRVAMREAGSGETLLLSPGAASFDQFKDFGERGDVFADLVHKEGTDK